MLTPNYRSVARHIATLLFSASAAFAITGGLDEPTMSQSVLMLATRGICSASIIAPRVLLTAAHCVLRGAIKVHWRDKSDTRRLSIVAEVRARLPIVDLALIRLTESLPEEYLPLPLTASIPSVGERVRWWDMGRPFRVNRGHVAVFNQLKSLSFVKRRRAVWFGLMAPERQAPALVIREVRSCVRIKS